MRLPPTRQARASPCAGVCVGSSSVVSPRVGGDEFVRQWTAWKGDDVVTFIRTTATFLRNHREHLWSVVRLSCAPRFDYWLQHLAPRFTTDPAVAVDGELLRAAAACGRPGMFAEDDGTVAEGVALRRLRLPVRRRGLGLRRRSWLAPVAFCASFAEAAARFRGAMRLGRIFAPGSFAPGGARLGPWLAAASPAARDFERAWYGLQQRLRGGADGGPLAADPAQAGVSHPRRLQHALTAQLEQDEFVQLQADVEQLPTDTPARLAFARAGRIGGAAFAAWPSSDYALAAAEAEGFADCFCHFLGCTLPLLHAAGAGGRTIPDDQLRVPRVCDLHGLQLETACLAGDSRIVRHDTIRDVISADLPGARTEPDRLLAHVLPQLRGRRPRQGLRPDIAARTRFGQPPARAARADRSLVWYDVKTVTPLCPRSRTGPAARSLTPSAVGDHRAAEVHGAAQTRCRELDAEHSPLPGAAAGTRYPAPAEQVARGLRGPVLCAYEEAVGAADGGRMHGIAVGSWQDCSAEVDALAGEAADAMAARHWRLMGSRTQAEARGVFVQHVQRRWSAAFWRSWRAMLHARLPCIGAASSSVLRTHAPAPDEAPVAWAEGRGAAFPQAHAGVDRGGAARGRA